MDGQVLAWGRLADVAAGGLIVLAAGSLAARLCRQPARRAWLIVLTLLGAMAVPALDALPVPTRWSAGLLPPPAPVPSRPDAEAPAVASRPDPPGAAAWGDPPRPVEGPGEASIDAVPSMPMPVPPGPVRPSPERRWVFPWAQAVFIGAYLVFAAGWAAWWLVGQVMLWRLTRTARPVPGAVRDAFEGLAGPEGRRVALLRTDRVALPFTYTWARPVILLPTALCDGRDPAALRYALAHEWSHVERRDAWVWNLAWLAGLVLLYQPLFWWLRRQLRLCQDYLADARADAAGSSEDHAAFLVRLARDYGPGPALPAPGIGDRRTNLYRRVIMLVQDHEPLERRCPRAWGLVAAAAAAVIVVASGLRLSADALPEAKAPAQEVQAVQDAPKAPADKPAGETLNYTGKVLDKDTGQPIAGATVVVRRSVYKSEDNRVLQETRHTTGADGSYSFTIPPEQVAEPALYIELDVEHPDYATRAGFGYALSMTRKNEKLNERPFFETIEMRPARPITGRVVTPEGKPAEGIELLAYSRTDKVSPGQFEYGSFARAKTDADGRFRLPITTPGRGVYWVLPDSYAPELFVLAEGKRGDVGTITLRKGVNVTGRVLDVQGKPLAGVFIEADRERGNTPEFEVLSQLTVADAIRRTVETDAEGRFTFGPLPPGAYRVMPTEVHFTGDRSTGWTRRDLPGVFAPTKLTIQEEKAPDPLEVRATPHVVIEGRWLDSQGKPKSGWGSSVFGRVDGAFWHAMTRPDAQGRFSLRVPHGMEEVQVDISTNEHASAKHRIGKDGPLEGGRSIKLGTLDHDVKDIEIVRYVAPILVINATDDGGRQIKGFQVAVEYTDGGQGNDKRVHVVGGEPKQAIQDEQYDGRYRTSTMLPDREVSVTVTAAGFQSASRTLTLPEGRVEDVNFVLKPN
jgi:protocatechuate 3,4-dioxygenase beta subunit